MITEKLYFTRRGLLKLHDEIDNLEKKLQELQAQVAYAAEVGGDQYHDNSSYELLVIDIRGVDRRLADAHGYLNRAVIVDESVNSDQVCIGANVKIERNGEKFVWSIVGFGESDPSKRMLAYNTPLASLIMGKHRGDVVNGVIGKKQVEIEILDISKGGESE